MKFNLKNIKEKRREITLISIVLMVIVLFFTGFSFGKGLTNTDIEVSSKIAEPILKIENTPPVAITTTNNTANYEFKIKNYNETGKITDVSLKYTIEILTEIEGINFKIYKNEQEILLQNQKTDQFILNNQDKQEDLYKLEIEYTPSLTGKDIFEYVQIKVHSEQQKA